MVRLALKSQVPSGASRRAERTARFAPGDTAAARLSSWPVAGFVLLIVWGFCPAAGAQESRFAQTYSRSQYVHRIDLLDAGEQKIDPTDPNPPPYSPAKTCGKCHPYETIAHGYHFHPTAPEVGSERSGEPWIWTDSRTGTQLPLSYRGWKGAYDPRELGISAWEFVQQFGRQLPGGGPGAGGGESSLAAATGAVAESTEAEGAGAEAAKAPSGRWPLSGSLEVDCMMCHSNAPAYSREAWRDEIAKQNLAWAPTAALGLGVIEGAVASLPDDFDPSQAADQPGPGRSLPRVAYDQNRFNAQQKVFFDIARKPSSDACYYCHTVREAGEDATPQWAIDQDVHLRAGMVCADCHRNGVEHDTVRGLEGEVHAGGVSVATLSCRGCHLDDRAGRGDGGGGRMGAPKPLHKGLPPVHLEKMSCTSCHSGPPPGQQARRWQTAMAHGLGLPSHDYAPENPPGIAAPVLLPLGQKLYPCRVTWPAFWGVIQGEKIKPLAPNLAYETLRRILRVRRGASFAEAMAGVRLTSEEKAQVLGPDRAKTASSQLTEQERAKLAQFGFGKTLPQALEAIKAVLPEPGGAPVYISGGKAYRLGADGKAVSFSHKAAEPYVWPLAHDVRPARWADGVRGCSECHSKGAPFFEGVVAAVGPAPDPSPAARVMYQWEGYDKRKIDAWNQSFQGRTAFKWVGFTAMGAVALILLSYLMLGVNGLFGWARRK